MESGLIVGSSNAELRPADKVPRLIAAFLSGRSEKTIEAYRRDLQDFAKFTKASTLDGAANLVLANGHGEANHLFGGNS